LAATDKADAGIDQRSHEPEAEEKNSKRDKTNYRGY
jgi:hypothetical protein